MRCFFPPTAEENFDEEHQRALPSGGDEGAVAGRSRPMVDSEKFSVAGGKKLSIRRQRRQMEETFA